MAFENNSSIRKPASDCRFNRAAVTEPPTKQPGRRRIELGSPQKKKGRNSQVPAAAKTDLVALIAVGAVAIEQRQTAQTE